MEDLVWHTNSAALTTNLNFWTGSEPHITVLSHPSIHIHTMVLLWRYFNILVDWSILSLPYSFDYLYVFCIESSDTVANYPSRLTKDISPDNAFAQAVNSVFHASLVSLFKDTFSWCFYCAGEPSCFTWVYCALYLITLWHMWL